MTRQTFNPFSGSPLLSRKPLDLFEKLERKYYLQERRTERNHRLENLKRAGRNWKYFIRAPYDCQGRLARAYRKFFGKQEKPYYLVKRPPFKEPLSSGPENQKTMRQTLALFRRLRKKISTPFASLRGAVSKKSTSIRRKAPG